MSERDDDILDFDFFDEPATVEQQPTQRVRMPRRRPSGTPPRGPRPPQFRTPQGFAPLARLIGLIVFAIAIVVLLVFWVQSCQGAAKKNAYNSYVTDVAQLAASSARVGRDLTDALTTPGQKVSDLQTALNGLAEREQQDVAKAQSLHPPGALRNEHQAVIQALQFRVSGLQGLAETLRTASTKGGPNTSSVLAQQSQRFVASDVIWDDLFKDPTRTELSRQGITGVSPPDSNFLVDPALTTSDSWSRVLQRLQGASTGGTTSGGVHGSALEYVKALSGGQTVADGKSLVAGSENTVTATTDLAFTVTIQDSGDAQEVGINVTLTIQQTPAIVRTQKIKVINPGQQKSVTFTNLGQVKFAQKEQVNVDVSPVPGETKTDNNKASYPVIFSLG